MEKKDLINYVRIRENWPKEGISFKDITSLVSNKEAFKYSILTMCLPFADKKVDKVLCADARGFIFGGAVAYNLGAAVVVARKPGKMPFVQYSASYSLEYGNNTLEIAPDTIKEGENVLIVDDLLATGGSAKALKELAEKAGGNIVGYSFAIELTGLKGRKLLGDKPIYSLINYEF